MLARKADRQREKLTGGCGVGRKEGKKKDQQGARVRPKGELN